MSQHPIKPTAFEMQKVAYGQSAHLPALRERSLTGIMQIMEREFNSFPEIAETFFYARPVGQGKVATGLSIRAAEFLANYYPNSNYTTEVVGEDEDSITLCATFRDEELNTSHSKTVKMSKWFKFKDGRVEKSDPDRLEIRIAAFTSKALREVVLRSMPVSLKLHVERRAKQIIDKKMMEPEAIKRLMVSFLNFGVEQKHVEKILDKALGKMDTEDRVFLLSLYNSITDGEINVQRLLDVLKDPKIRNVRLAISDLVTGNPLGGGRGVTVVDVDDLGEVDASGEPKKGEASLSPATEGKKRGRPRKVESVTLPESPAPQSVTLENTPAVNEDADDPTLTPLYQANVVPPGE